MSILSTIGRLAAEYSEARARYLTERSIHALPIELQKDIGWPDAYETRHEPPLPCRLVSGAQATVKCDPTTCRTGMSDRPAGRLCSPT